MHGGVADDPVQQHQGGGQNDQNDSHTDQCAAGDKPADALQQLHLTDGGHADGSGKEGQAAGQDTKYLSIY